MMDNSTEEGEKEEGDNTHAIRVSDDVTEGTGERVDGKSDMADKLSEVMTAILEENAELDSLMQRSDDSWTATETPGGSLVTEAKLADSHESELDEEIDVQLGDEEVNETSSDSETNASAELDFDFEAFLRNLTRREESTLARGGKSLRSRLAGA